MAEYREDSWTPMTIQDRKTALSVMAAASFVDRMVRIGLPDMRTVDLLRRAVIDPVGSSAMASELPSNDDGVRLGIHIKKFARLYLEELEENMRRMTGFPNSPS